MSTSNLEELTGAHAPVARQLWIIQMSFVLFEDALQNVSKLLPILRFAQAVAALRGGGVMGSCPPNF